MNKGGQPGNSNAVKNKPFADAIERALKKGGKKGRKKLDDIVEKLIEMGLAGDLGAIKEIADRQDGKAKQSAEVKALIQVNEIVRKIIKAPDTDG